MMTKTAALAAGPMSAKAYVEMVLA